MAKADIFEALRAKGYQIEFHSHARAILMTDFSSAMKELADVLGGVTIPIEEIVASGGGEAKGTQRLRKALVEKGWKKELGKARRPHRTECREPLPASQCRTSGHDCNV